MKSIILYLGLFLGLFIGSVFFCELLLLKLQDGGSNIIPNFQTLDFYPYYRLSKNKKRVFQINPGVTFYEDRKSGFKTNSLGFRDIEYPEIKPAETTRILLAGGSISFGLDMPQEVRWSEILERELNQLRPTEVINMAVPSYNLTQMVEAVLDDGVKLKPDLVILSLWDDDLNPPFIPAFNREYTGGVFRAHKELLEISNLYKLLFYHLFVLGKIQRDLREVTNSEGIESFQKLLRYSKAHSLPVLCILNRHLMIDPPKARLESLKSDSKMHSMVHFLDLGKPLSEEYSRGLNPKELRLAPDDMAHLSRKGHQVLAGVIQAQLLKNGFYLSSNR